MRGAHESIAVTIAYPLHEVGCSECDHGTDTV